MKIEVRTNPNRAELRPLLESLPSAYDSLGTLIYSGRNSVRAIDYDGQRIIAKRFRRPDLLKQLGYLLLGTGKAVKACKYAEIFRERGIDTPESVGYTLVRRHGLVFDSYFVSLPCEGAPLYDTLHAGGNPALVSALARELARMHRQGLLHGDLNARNIFYGADGDGYQFRFIDINRSKTKAEITPADAARNLFRLTHDRKLLAEIVAAYAQEQGWDEQSLVDATLARLTRFQKKKIFLGKLKGKKITFPN